MPEAALAGRVALITGAAGELGAVTAERLARSGAVVAIADLDAAGVDRVAAGLVAQGLDVHPFSVDLSDEDDIRKLVDAVGGLRGRIDILHNNAAATGPDGFGQDGTLFDLTTAAWDTSYAVNVRAPMLLSKYVIPLMPESGGVIVNTSTEASVVPTSRLAYSTSKAALNMLTRCIAALYGDRKIRCNAVVCGAITGEAMRRQFPEAVLDAIVAKSGLGEPLLPADVAALVHFLVSDEARLITGQLLPIDGGKRLG